MIAHAATSGRLAPPPDDGIITIAIAIPADIATAREAGRDYAIRLGFSPTDVTMISTAISEVARNITSYAGHGEICLLVTDVQGRRALMVQARDEGPGIADIALALGHGYTPGRRRGLGLPGARRLMDGLTIDTGPGRGTLVEMWKWIPVSTRRGVSGRSVR
jgi:serine/threonine-protein kinase RsbT